MTSCIVATFNQFSRGCQNPSDIHVHIIGGHCELSVFLLKLAGSPVVATNVNIVGQENLPVGVNPVKHLFTVLFKHPQLKALVQFGGSRATLSPSWVSSE